MKEPLDHVARAPLPWRDDSMTECGHAIGEFTRVLTHDQFAAKVKEQGQQRSALTSCMTCWSTAGRHPGSWDANPVAVMDRETSAARWAQTKSPLAAELRAVALLIAAHRDEFDETLRGLSDAPTLADARQERRRRRGLA